MVHRISTLATEGVSLSSLAPDQMITTEELAIVARTSPESVRYWDHVGKGPKSAKIGRRRLYRVADVQAWLDEQFEKAAS